MTGSVVLATMSLHFVSVFAILKRAMSPDTVFMQVVCRAPFSGKTRAQPTGNFKFLKQSSLTTAI